MRMACVRIPGGELTSHFAGLADAAGGFPDYLMAQAEEAGDAPGCSPFAAIRERGASAEPHDPVDREGVDEHTR